MRFWSGLIGAAWLALMANGAQAATWAFLQPEDPASVASLTAHIDRIDGLMPAWVQVLGPTDDIHVVPDPPGHAAIAAAGKPLPVLPLVYNAANEKWFGQQIAAMLADPARRSSLIGRLETQLMALGAKGATFDFEELPASAQADYVSFLAQVRARFSKRGWRVGVAVASADPAWDLKAYGQAADLILLMDYDQHWPGGEPGPVAANPWFEANMVRALSLVPSNKLIVGMAAYGYDWASGGGGTSLPVPDALAIARRMGVAPQRDAASGSMTYAYVAAGVSHTVWFPDAETTAGQLALTRAHGAKNVAFWRLGLEQPELWAAFSPSRR